MSVDRNGARPLPVAEALGVLPKIAGKERVPGLLVPNQRLNGASLIEAVLLTARDGGANYLTGDPRVTNVKLAQVEAGGEVDTVLTYGRSNGDAEVRTELLISGGRVSEIRNRPGKSYSEVPASPQEEALARRVLTNIVALQ